MYGCNFSMTVICPGCRSHVCQNYLKSPEIDHTGKMCIQIYTESKSEDWTSMLKYGVLSKSSRIK